MSELMYGGYQESVVIQVKINRNTVTFITERMAVIAQFGKT